MKVLHKTFDVLEFMMLQGGHPATPGEVASAIGLPPATAARILAVLGERGYLEKVSRQSGYRPGPMMASLANLDNIYHRMAAAGSVPVRELAARVGDAVNLAVLFRGNRVMLVYSGGSPTWSSPWKTLLFHDHFHTATGRILAAEQEPDEALKLVSSFPVGGWPECGDEKTFLSECAAIRKAGGVRFRGVFDQIIIGHPIRVPGYPVAAVGFGVRDHERADEMFKLSAECAGKITSLLKTNYR